MTLDRTRYNCIFPENLDTPKREGRANKPFTIITTSPPKQEDPVLWNHCKFHRDTRLIQGYFCEFCGPTLPATRNVDTI